MTTLVQFGPKDHGRSVSADDLENADFSEGFRYEVIEGRLYVSPVPNLSENQLESWIFGTMYLYSRTHPESANYVSCKPRVFVSESPLLTVPEPDVAVYRNFPVDLDIEDVVWQDVSPILVIEVLTGDGDKDLVRNVALYGRVDSIREYWVIDGRESQSRPDLRVHRRRGRQWVIRDYQFDTLYSTRLLPDFSLRVNPRS